MSRLFASGGGSIGASALTQYGHGNSGAHLELQDATLILFKKTFFIGAVALQCRVGFAVLQRESAL